MLVHENTGKRNKVENKLFAVLYLSMLSYFFLSCNTDKDSGIPEFQDDTSDVTPGDISDRLIARIYFHTTLSMQGFVVSGSTHYTRICPALESVIVSGWTDGKADFFTDLVNRLNLFWRRH